MKTASTCTVSQWNHVPTFWKMWQFQCAIVTNKLDHTVTILRSCMLLLQHICILDKHMSSWYVMNKYLIYWKDKAITNFYEAAATKEINWMKSFLVKSSNKLRVSLVLRERKCPFWFFKYILFSSLLKKKKNSCNNNSSYYFTGYDSWFEMTLFPAYRSNTHSNDNTSENELSDWMSLTMPLECAM